MIEQILLTKKQAAYLAGKYGKHSEILPVETETGDYALPVQVMKDPDLVELHRLIAPFLREEKFSEKVKIKLSDFESRKDAKSKE